MSSNRTHVTIMIEAALCVALSYVLSRINLFEMPQGGSINFELVPLMVFAFRRGIRRGAGAAFIAGIVRVLMGAYFFNIVQVFLDYPLAYAFVGLAAINPKVIGLILAFIGETTCSVISGVVFFAEYAPEGQSPLVYSLFYNVPILGAKYLVSGIAAIILWKALDKALPVSE